MKQKTRKLGIRMKILLPMSFMLILIGGILGAEGYLSSSKGMVEMGVEQAQMAAKIALQSADGDAIAKLEPGCEDTQNYKQVLAALREVQEEYNILYLYTVYAEGTNLYYGVDTDKSEMQAYVGKPFEKDYEMLKGVLNGQEFAQNYIDYSAYGEVISVYEPIRNSKGEVVGILGSDYDASSVVNHLSDIQQRIFWITIVCLLMSLLIIGGVTHAILRGLRKVDAKLFELINNEGDLTQKLEISSGDELELIANNINHLLEYIRVIMMNIADNSGELTKSSQNVVQNLMSAGTSVTDVSATMEEMSAAMEETSASMNQVSTSVEGVYLAIETIAQNADEGKHSSNQIMDRAESIHSSAVQERQKVSEQAQEMAELMNEKIQKSRAVEQIDALTETILSITGQTNLLALNASIEAARAGEAGRGFAVVADEIGKLAGNSAQTATQIQQVSTQVIQAVNELAERAADMLAFIDKVAMGGYEKLMETSQSYRNDVGDMNLMMNGFAEESEQIKQNVEHIREAVTSVNIAVEETAKGVNAVTETAMDLTDNMSMIGEEANANREIAQKLNQEVNKFKLK